MSKPAGVPPMPNLPGGGVPILGQPQQVPPTIHETTFHGCEAGMYALLDDDNRCVGYRLIIRDPREAHQYTFGFEQDLKDTWQKDLNNFPNVGEVPPEAEGNGSI